VREMHEAKGIPRKGGLRDRDRVLDITQPGTDSVFRLMNQAWVGVLFSFHFCSQPLRRVRSPVLFPASFPCPAAAEGAILVEKAAVGNSA